MKTKIVAVGMVVTLIITIMVGCSAYAENNSNKKVNTIQETNNVENQPQEETKKEKEFNGNDADYYVENGQGYDREGNVVATTPEEILEQKEKEAEQRKNKRDSLQLPEYGKLTVKTITQAQIDYLNPIFKKSTFSAEIPQNIEDVENHINQKKWVKQESIEWNKIQLQSNSEYVKRNKAKIEYEIECDTIEIEHANRYLEKLEKSPEEWKTIYNDFCIEHNKMELAINYNLYAFEDGIVPVRIDE